MADSFPSPALPHLDWLVAIFLPIFAEKIAHSRKELVGSFDNRGRRWQPAGDAEQVNVHDFPGQSVGKAIPYGTYDVTRDEAVVNVGITHDTAEFAVASIRRWWQLMGRKAYPQARNLLICADAGGSNGSRLRSWKIYLQALADRLGIAITVCHYPPGTSNVECIVMRSLPLTGRSSGSFRRLFTPHNSDAL